MLKPVKENAFDFQQKIALVTGAGRGIGAALATELCRRGARVVGVARTEAELQATAKIAGENFISRVCDLSVPAQIQSLFADLEKQNLIPTIVINNAGVIVVKKIEELSLSDYELMMKVNLQASFLISQEVFKRATEESSILNVSSLAGVMGEQKFLGFSLYTAAKAAVVGMTEAMAVEGRAKNIRVNVVCPGAVDTQMLRQAFPKLKAGRKPEDVVDSFLSIIQRSFLESLTGHVEVLSND